MCHAALRKDVKTVRLKSTVEAFLLYACTRASRERLGSDWCIRASTEGATDEPSREIRKIILRTGGHALWPIDEPASQSDDVERLSRNGVQTSSHWQDIMHSNPFG